MLCWYKISCASWWHTVHSTGLIASSLVKGWPAEGRKCSELRSSFGQRRRLHGWRGQRHRPRGEHVSCKGSDAGGHGAGGCGTGGSDVDGGDCKGAVLASRSEGKRDGGAGGGRNGNGGNGCSGDGCSGGDMLETGESWSSVPPPPPLNNSASHRRFTAQQCTWQAVWLKMAVKVLLQVLGPLVLAVISCCYFSLSFSTFTSRRYLLYNSCV